MDGYIDIDIDVEKIPSDKIKVVKSKVDGSFHSYIKLRISPKKTIGKFGEDLSVEIPRTPEERDANAPRLWVGNGKTFESKY